MNVEQKAYCFDTQLHIERVRNLLNKFVNMLLDRGEVHDQCKLKEPELDLFMEMTDKLASSTYGSSEYEDFRKKLKPALDHHYSNSRHHPEHHKNGINDMNLIDLVEMFCDWKASSERHHNGNILKSIEVNKSRFDLSEQLGRILENTAKLLD